MPNCISATLIYAINKNIVSSLDNKPNKNILYSLLACVHLTTFPLYSATPIPIILLLLTLSIWQAFIIYNGKKNPGKLVLLIVISATLLTIFYTYGFLFGRQPGITLVILMSILKLFETKNLRDCYIIIYSAFFIIASNFFHSQTVWLTIYVFIVVVILTTILIALSDKLGTLSFKTRFKMSTRYFVYAAPLMVVLFILFPRIPGPLWGLQKDVFSSQTGLSEEMSPGSFNRLISSSSIAFRVKFDSVIPEHSQLYWRGIVLSLYNGTTWHRADAPKTTVPNINFTEDHTDFIKYTITLEPTNLKWLLSLEFPIDHESQYKVNREAMLTTKKAVGNVISYSITSDTRSTNIALFEQESYKNRLLPVNLNPETLNFAKKLFIQSKLNDQQYINNVLQYYRVNEFYYTLDPDLLGNNAMDDFLFKTRRGFCEHYASSFVYLMRAVGIPSRVVIGYQGGTINPLDDYMIVRQSDAHAWAEVWINDVWQRVDPTAAVSPDRIEKGISNSGLDINKLPLLLVTNSTLLKNTAFLYDSFQNSWNQWVINFDHKKQTNLLKNLGFKDATYSDLILLLIISFSITGLIVSWFLLKQYTIEKDNTQHYYNIFCKKLKRYGIHRNFYEGPNDFEARVLNELLLTPQARNDVTFVFKAYRTLHYGNQINTKLTNLYIKKIKSLKL